MTCTPANATRATLFDRRTLLAGFADDAPAPAPVVGADRHRAAAEIAGYLRGIRPDDLGGARLAAALGGDTPARYLGATHRRLAAFTNGVAYLHAAYWSEGLTNGDGTDLADTPGALS